MADKPTNTPKVATHPKWDVDDALVLRTFLESDTGRRTLEWLKFWAPVLLDGSHVNKALVASGEVKGHMATIENLHSLTRENPIPEPLVQEQSEEYPDLDDDTKWNEKTDKRE